MNQTGPLYHCWSALLTLVFLFNALSIWMTVFVEFRRYFFTHWLVMNAITDAFNLVDLFVQAKKEYQKDGIIIRDFRRTFLHYFFNWSFLLDFIAILPTDLLLLIWPDLFMLRLNRLAKIDRVLEFTHLTERRAPWPLGFRLLRLATLCFLLFHWNACLYFLLSSIYGYEDSTVNDWTFSYQKIPDMIFPLCDARFDVHRNECLFPEEDWRQRPWHLEELRAHWEKRLVDHTQFNNLTKKYAMSFYWSALTLVTLGEQPWPANSVQTVFEIVNTIIGLLVFSAIIGDIGIMVSSAHSATANFQEFVDGCKRYMRIRHVNDAVRDRVINWIEYQWIWGDKYVGSGGAESVDMAGLVSLLPPRLAKELAAESYLPSLLGSPVFYLCERGLLMELAIRLQPRRFGPGDVVCRRGEIAKEMFIVRHGQMELLLEDSMQNNADADISSGDRSISPTLNKFYSINETNRFLHEGDLFGDWALVSESKHPFTVRSVGYSCICTLGRDAMAAAFEEYPHSRRMVRRKANLIRQRHEQRWNPSNGSASRSAMSFDSEEFLFSRRRMTTHFERRPSRIYGDDSTLDEDEATADGFGADFMEQASLESRLRGIQRAVESITNEVEKAEKHFVNTSMEFKQWLSAVEHDYQEQRPRLKKLLGKNRRRKPKINSK